MPVIFRRLFGLIVSLVSAASLLVTFFLISQTWLLKNKVTDRLLSGVVLGREMLDTSLQTLEITEQTLVAAIENISTTQSALLTLAESAHETTDLIDSLITLTGDTLPGFVNSTAYSLDSAKDTARLIDGMMSAISRIPFLGVKPYDPEKSLTQALENVSSDLDQLEPQLGSMETELKQSKQNLTVLEKQIENFVASLGITKEELHKTSDVIEAYRKQIRTLQNQLKVIQGSLPGWVRSTAFLLSFLSGWLVILQGYLLYKGLKIFVQPRG